MSSKFYNYLLRLNDFERKMRLNNSLAVGLNEFKIRWKKYAEEFQFPYNNLEVNLENHILHIKLQNIDNIVFLGEVIDYKEELILKSITMIASGDGSIKSGVNIFTAINILVACLNPYEGAEFRKKLLNDLRIIGLEIGTKNEVVINSFKYTVNFSKELGFWFKVSRYS